MALSDLTRITMAFALSAYFAVDAKSDADCALYPSCAGLSGNCCPNDYGQRMACCDGPPPGSTNLQPPPSVVQMPPIQGFAPPSAVQMPYGQPPIQGFTPPSAFHMPYGQQPPMQGFGPPPMVQMPYGQPPIQGCPPMGCGVPCAMPPPMVQMPYGQPPVQEPCALSPFGVPSGQPLAAFGVPPPSPTCTFAPQGSPVLGGPPLEEGDCVLASQRIRYAGGEEVPPQTLGTVAAHEPHIGVDWVGFDTLVKAFARPDQLERPRPLQGKLVGVKDDNGQPLVRCLSAGRQGAGTVRMVSCADSADQSFTLPPCGTGYIVWSSGNLCLEATAARGPAALSPCDGKPAQVFKLSLNDRQLEATVAEDRRCYDLGGEAGDELVAVECGAARTKFSFA